MDGRARLAWHGRQGEGPQHQNSVQPVAPGARRRLPHRLRRGLVMADLTRSATAATAPQQPGKRLLQTTPRNSPATVGCATSATTPQQACNKAQQPRNSLIFVRCNSATSPYRGGETVAPPRAHPRTPGQTPSRLRLRAFRPGHRARGRNAPHTQDNPHRRPAEPIGYRDRDKMGLYCPRHRHEHVDIQRQAFARSTPGPPPDQQRESASAFSYLPAIGATEQQDESTGFLRDRAVLCIV